MLTNEQKLPNELVVAEKARPGCLGIQFEAVAELTKIRLHSSWSPEK